MLISKWYHGECSQNLFPLWYFRLSISNCMSFFLFNLTRLKLCMCSSPGIIFVTSFWKLLNQGLKLHLLIRISYLASGTWLSFSLLTLFFRESDSDQQFDTFVKRHLTFCSVGIFKLKWNWVSWWPTSIKTNKSCCFAALFFPAVWRKFLSAKICCLVTENLSSVPVIKKIISDPVNWITAIWLI